MQLNTLNQNSPFKGFLKCLGNISNPKHIYLNGISTDGTVNLVADINPENHSGTYWEIEKLNDGSIALKCLGNIANPNYVYLNGNTTNGNVDLVADTETSPKNHSGSHWQVEQLTDMGFALKCLGNNPNPDYVYLNGITPNGTVNLVADTDFENYSGTYWEFIPADGCQTGSYDDDFQYLTPAQSSDSNNFNNWFWELYPQKNPIADVSAYASFQFQVKADDAQNPNALCSQLIIKGNVQDGQYQDSEIFNNGCSYNSSNGNAGGFQPQCSTPFPNGRLSNVKAPYTVTNSCLDNGGMFLQSYFSDTYIKNTPYYPSEEYSYCVEMRIKAAGQTFGTRGWGFWNTNMPPNSGDYFAWFWEFGVQFDLSNDLNNSRLPLVFPVAMTQSETQVCCTILWINIYEWHDYKIVWSKDNVKYYIDGTLVAKHNTAPPIGIRGGGMAYHCWVDNRLFYNGGYNNNFILPCDKSNFMGKFKAYPIATDNNNEVPADNKWTFCFPIGNLNDILVKLKETCTEYLKNK